MKDDILQRFLFDDANVRGEILSLSDSWQTLLARSDYNEATRQLLGQAMAATLLMSATIKFDGTLTLQVSGDGPVSLLVMQVDNQRRIRGMARADAALNSTLPAEAFGEAPLVMTVSTGKHEYQSLIPLIGDSLGDCLQAYFQQSEQLPTRFWLAVSDTRVRALMLQRLPDGSDDQWQHLLTLTDTLRPDELLEVAPEELLHRLYHQQQLRLLASEDVAFHCHCSRERSAAGIRQLGADELRKMIAEQEVISVQCGFCNADYRFDAVDVEQLLRGQETTGTPPGDPRH